MENPYEILDLKKGATKDEVRRAYKKLAKQYHPDQYGDNPLKDLAEERMVEINKAYDELMKSFDKDTSSRSSHNSNSSGNTYNRTSSGNYNQSSSYNRSSNYNNSNSNNNYNQNYQSGGANYGYYQEVKNEIYSGNLRGAEQKLNSVKTRDAEWNYLMGILYTRKGWHDSARRYLSTATRMNPANPEYQNALSQISHDTTSYRQNYYGRRHRDNDMFDLCFKLWCADSLCECAGGDLIDCM